jgi:hypothetical protein
MTFRELTLSVALFQRTYLDVLGWMDYAEIYGQRIADSGVNAEPFPVDEKLIGAWTTEACVAQKLFLAGVPVWLFRAEKFIPQDMTVVNAPISISCLPDIVTEDWVDGAGNIDRFPSIYRGESGAAMMAAIRFHSPTFIDHHNVQTEDLRATHTAAAGPHPYRARRSSFFICLPIELTVLSLYLI